MTRARIMVGALIGVTGGAVAALIGGLLAIPVLGIPDEALATTYGHELLTRWIPAVAVFGLVAGGLLGARPGARQ